MLLTILPPAEWFAPRPVSPCCLSPRLSAFLAVEIPSSFSGLPVLGESSFP